VPYSAGSNPAEATDTYDTERDRLSEDDTPLTPEETYAEYVGLVTDTVPSYEGACDVMASFGIENWSLNYEDASLLAGIPVNHIARVLAQVMVVCAHVENEYIDRVATELDAAIAELVGEADGAIDDDDSIAIDLMHERADAATDGFTSAVAFIAGLSYAATQVDQAEAVDVDWDDLLKEAAPDGEEEA
jgi:hypothetical protein